ncbi:MAG: 50S ribosomal protein L4 [Anaerolineae bacterium]|nr:50S ribosomal protein L4 [Thermoflexus sp.]MDW8065015.1 50S ribosomal protein L4 [Anaerolineae bacterium]
MRVPVWNIEGQQVGEIELRPEVFEARIHMSLMHQALVRQLANARLGTHKTKTRGEVHYSGRKLWPQKHTGRARQGSRDAPQWYHGGVVFGPRPRSYQQKMPKKMRRAALRSALSVKAKEGQILVLDRLELPEPRTKLMKEILERLPVGQSVLILLADPHENIKRATHNLPNVAYLHPMCLNIRDLFKYETLIIPQDVLPIIEDWLTRPVVPKKFVSASTGAALKAG